MFEEKSRGSEVERKKGRVAGEEGEREKKREEMGGFGVCVCVSACVFWVQASD